MFNLIWQSFGYCSTLPSVPSISHFSSFSCSVLLSHCQLISRLSIISLLYILSLLSRLSLLSQLSKLRLLSLASGLSWFSFQCKPSPDTRIGPMTVEPVTNGSDCFFWPGFPYFHDFPYCKAIVLYHSISFHAFHTFLTFSNFSYFLYHAVWFEFGCLIALFMTLEWGNYMRQFKCLFLKPLPACSKPLRGKAKVLHSRRHTKYKQFFKLNCYAFVL